MCNKEKEEKAFEEQIKELFEEARKNVKPCKFIGFQENNKALQNAKKILKMK